MGLTRKRQVAIAIESTEGVAESLTSAEAGLLVYEPSLNHDVAIFARTPARASLSTLPKLAGIRTGTLNFRMELRGSGTASTSPDWAVPLKACGFRELTLWTLTGGTASAAFEHGTTVTQATSAATGVVVKDVSASAATMMVAVTSGTFDDTNQVSDDFSAATYTPTGHSVVGLVYLPDSATPPSVTIMSREDGIYKQLRGARGNVNMAANVGEPVFLEFSFQGVEDVVDDAALFTGVTFKVTQPPKFQAVSFTTASYAAVISSFGLAKNNVLAVRTSANATEGAVSVLITNQGITGNIDPEAVLVATQDFYNDCFDAVLGEMDFTIGTAAGNQIEVFAPRAQYDSVGDGDRNGIALSPVTFSLHTGTENSPADDELAIIHK